LIIVVFVPNDNNNNDDEINRRKNPLFATRNEKAFFVAPPTRLCFFGKDRSHFARIFIVVSPKKTDDDDDETREKGEELFSEHALSVFETTNETTTRENVLSLSFFSLLCSQNKRVKLRVKRMTRERNHPLFPHSTTFGRRRRKEEEENAREF